MVCECTGACGLAIDIDRSPYETCALAHPRSPCALSTPRCLCAHQDDADGAGNRCSGAARRARSFREASLFGNPDRLELIFLAICRVKRTRRLRLYAHRCTRVCLLCNPSVHLQRSNMGSDEPIEVLIVGSGIFGASLAVELAKGPFKRQGSKIVVIGPPMSLHPAQEIPDPVRLRSRARRTGFGCGFVGHQQGKLTAWPALEPD